MAAARGSAAFPLVCQCLCQFVLPTILAKPLLKGGQLGLNIRLALLALDDALAIAAQEVIDRFHADADGRKTLFLIKDTFGLKMLSPVSYAFLWDEQHRYPGNEESLLDSE